MKAAVLFESPGALQIEDVAVDSPGSQEVVIRVGAAGLCHSDLHYLQRETQIQTPIVLGHEGAGVVEAVGDGVSYVKPGDHVVTFPRAFCGHCEYCLSGRPTICEQEGLFRAPGERPRLSVGNGTRCGAFTGLGAFAERMLVHENTVAKIDADIPMTVAALVGCAVPTGVGAVTRTAKVPPGATVAVIGCGGIGLNTIQGAVIAGASRIIGIDINDGKLDFARKFGATDVINSSRGHAVERLAELLPGKGGVDYSFEAIGLKETYELAFAVLRRGGTATGIGVAPGNFELPAAALVWERKFQGSIMGSVRFREDLPFLLDLYRSGRLKLDELVSNQIQLSEINEGYAAITDGSIARSVIVFE
jgi:S-(hydroxymethyl)glutathione dehydrogenase / alcohol dehydrogenase